MSRLNVNVIRTKKLKLMVSKLILGIFTFLVLPSLSFASSAGSGVEGDMVTQVIQRICDWLSGAPAVAIGVLAVIYSGYEMLHGEIDKRKLIIRCTAIAMIIGGAYIGKNIIMGGGV